MALDCRPGLSGLNQVYGPNCLTPSVQSICGKYINIFTRCTIRNQHDILKTAVADVSKWQTDMSHKGELQTLTKLSMRQQVCPSVTWRIFISESIIIMPMSVGGGGEVIAMLHIMWVYSITFLSDNNTDGQQVKKVKVNGTEIFQERRDTNTLQDSNVSSPHSNVSPSHNNTVSPRRKRHPFRINNSTSLGHTEYQNTNKVSFKSSNVPWRNANQNETRREKIDNKIKVLYTNADQLSNKLPELLINIGIFRPDVIVVTQVLPKNQWNKNNKGFYPNKRFLTIY